MTNSVHMSSDALMLQWKYRNWLKALKEGGANFVTAAQVSQADQGGISKTECNVLLRHDVDSCELGSQVWPLLQLEYSLGIRSTTYLFAEDSKNWRAERTGLFRRKRETLRLEEQVLFYQSCGFEFGLHVDVIGRCTRTGDSVEQSEALRYLKRDVQKLRSRGIHVRTMAAHGFCFADGKRSFYDNYAAEFDATALSLDVLSQFHLLEHFARYGRAVSEAIGEKNMAGLQSTWAPQLRPFNWLHAKTSHDLKADLLTFTDAVGEWKYLSIAHLVELLPKLAGCMVVMNIHPVYWVYGDDGLEFSPHKLSNTDCEGLSEFFPNAVPERTKNSLSWPKVWPARAANPYPYKGSVNFENLDENALVKKVGEQHLGKINEALKTINRKLGLGSWFEELMHHPNPALVLWLDEYLERNGRDELRVIELCGAVGPVAICLTQLGVSPSRVTVSDFDARHVDIGQRLNEALWQGKMSFRHLDIRDLSQVRERYDLAIVSSWENEYVQYADAVRECSTLLNPGGIVLMTFIEEALIRSEGYDYAPERMLQRKTYHTILAEELLKNFLDYGLEPVTLVDSGYPGSRFPRHFVAARRVVSPKTRSAGTNSQVT